MSSNAAADVAAAPSMPTAPASPPSPADGIEKAGSKKAGAPELTSQRNHLSSFRISIVFVGTALLTFLSVIDGSIVATSLYTMSSDLNGGALSVWIASAYLMSMAAGVPTFARLSDIWGRKVLTLCLIVLFFCASLGAALSQTIFQLIVFRALQGLFGGGLICLANVIPADIVSFRERGKFVAIVEVFSVTANSIGPILGGAFARINWRLCYYFVLPPSVAAFLIILFALPQTPMRGNWRSKLYLIDYGGTLLMIGSTVSFLLAMNWGGITYPWHSPQVISTMTCGVLGYMLFIAYEGFVPSMPIVPLYIFRNKAVSALTFYAFCGTGFSFFPLIYFVPTWMQIMKGASTIESGLFLLSLMVPTTFAVFLAGQFTSRTGIYVPLLYGGTGIFALCIGLFATVNPETPNARIAVLLAFAGMGVGATLQTALVAVQVNVAERDIAPTSGMKSFVGQMGGTVGVAMGSSLLNNAVGLMGLPANIAKELIENPASLNHGLVSPAQVILVKQVYQRQFIRLFATCSAVSGCAAILLFVCVRHIDLPTRAETRDAEEVAVSTMPATVPTTALPALSQPAENDSDTAKGDSDTAKGDSDTAKGDSDEGTPPPDSPLTEKTK